MPVKAKNTDTTTFCLPPEMAQQLRQVVVEFRTVSELLREAICLYMEELEWRRQEQMQRRLSCQTGKNKTQGGETDG